MGHGRDSWVFYVVHHFDWRWPFKIRLHAPNEWNWASSLHIRCNFKRSWALVVNKDVFSLDEVGGVSLDIEPTSNKSSSWSSTIFPGDQIEVCLTTNSELWTANEHITKYAWHSKWRVLYAIEFSEQIVIKHVLIDIPYCVRICFFHLNVVLVADVTWSGP